MKWLDKLFRRKEATPAGHPQKPSRSVPRNLMLSQYAALYCENGGNASRKAYLSRLTSLGLSEKEAEAMFAFDCAVIRKYPKAYLLLPEFTKMWFFGLKQPFFLNEPKAKPDLLRERFFTISEICKLIDEAEWHYWNSHERRLPESIWSEICAWRLKGPGGRFAIEYFDTICADTGIPPENLAKISSDQGAHLSRYKWR